MYSVVLLMAVTVGGESADRHRGGCHSRCAPCYSCAPCYPCYPCYTECYPCVVVTPPDTTGGGDGGPPPTKLSAEEEKQLKEMLDAYKDDPEQQKKIKGAFEEADAAGRKAIYEEFKKASKTSVSKLFYRAPRRATILVSVPASSRLTVDGAATQATSSVRTFETPHLVSNKVYFYVFRAEFSAGGQTVSVAKKVQVKAGKETAVDFRPAIAVAFAKKVLATALAKR